ncbi:MAG: hypothetical protein ACI31M_03590 [Bacilli bacterium]
MEFLKEVGFSEKEIKETEKNIPDLLAEQIKKAKELVLDNINFLKDLGVTNYQEAFMAYYDMFLMDPSNFQDIFNKYDREDLIKKIAKNVAIIEHL